MEIEQLKQGLDDAKIDDAKKAQDIWLSKENLMKDYGSWFNNNDNMGELLLSELRKNGVDTQAATEAMLREILQGLVDDTNWLQQQFANFSAMLAKQAQATQATANAVTSAIEKSGASAVATDLPVAEGEVPPVAEGEVPPVAEGEVPPVAEGEVPPVAEDEVPPVAEGVVSDERLKKVYKLNNDGKSNVKCKFDENQQMDELLDLIANSEVRRY